MDNIEKIARELAEWNNRDYEYENLAYCWEDLLPEYKEKYLGMASCAIKAILSDSNIIEIDPEAELPENPYTDTCVLTVESPKGMYQLAQQDMLKAGWKKEKR